jgi:adenylyltransferase/sulfurtransferase
VVDDINHKNMARLADGADILVDGLDNFETRYLANDYAVKYALPYLYGGAVGTTGMAFTMLPHSHDGNAAWETLDTGSVATPCFRCLFEQAPPGDTPTCDTIGVLGPAVSIIANFQAAEAIKVLTGNFAQLNPRLLNIDLWTNMVTQLDLGRGREENNCPSCKQRNFEFLDGKTGSSAASLCGRDAVQLLHKQSGTRINLEALAQRLQAQGPVTLNEFLLRAEIREKGKNYEISLFNDGRAIIKGTGDATEARGIYAKYVGI